METIGTSAFAKCKSLTSITIEAANPPTISANTVPADVKKNIVLTVPKGSLAAYKAAANWDGFKEYKEADGGGGGGGGGTGSDEPYALVDGIYYEMDHTANTASVVSGSQAGMSQTEYSGVVTVPSTFIYNTKTYTVTAVKGMAFQNATCTEVTLPSSCTTINAYSFSNMSSLVKLNIGGTSDIKGNGITNCAALRDLYIGFTGGVVGTVNASIPATLRQNINVHMPANSITSDLAKSYKSNSFWTATRALLCNNELQIGDLYYRYDATKKTATMMAPYIIPGNGAPKQIGPEVDVPGSITVDGTEYVVDNLEAGAFYMTPNVTSVTFHEGLKNIEYESFYATRVGEVSFPNSLENLAYNNFYYCSQLTKVSFGTGLKTIGQNTFYKCPLLTNIEVQATVPPTPATGATSIFNANFNKSAATLTVPAGTTAAYQADANWSGFGTYKEIGGMIEEGRIIVDGVHYEITKKPYEGIEGALQCYVVSPVESGWPNDDEYSGVINIPEFISYNNKQYAVAQISNQAFYMQSAVTEVKVPSTVNIIGMQAFQESGITTITLPAKLISINNNAFRRCTALKTMTALGLTPASVGSGAFATITSTCKLYVPKCCVAAYKAADGWKDFASIEEDPNSAILPTSVEITGMPRTMLIGDTVQLGVVILPENTTDKSVEWKSLTPDIATVDSLGVVTAVGSGNAIIEVICNGNRTLSNNANVICVTAQDVIDGISYRFELNEKAQIANAYVIRPKTGSYAGDVVIPQFVQHGSTFKVRGIDNNAFALMADLTSVSIPATVDTMGLNAFRNCSNLKRVNITNLDSWMNISFRDPQATPFNMDSVQMYLNGELVTAVHIPGTMKTLKPYVFQGVSSIKSLVIDNGVRLISQNAFKNCKNLQAVVIPSSVDSIGMSAFSGCSSLASVQLPEGIKTIASSAFSNTGLTKITLPESVTLVDNQAFQNCAALKTATLGSSLKKLNLLVFNGCTALDTLTVKAAVPPTFFIASIPGQDMNPFSTSIYATCRLYVPESSLALYKEADVWKKFARIRAIGSVESEKAVIDGISYELFADDSTATVLASPDYTGEITVPDTVVYNSKTYSVTTIAPRAFAGTNIDILRLPANIKAIPEEMAANCTKLISVGLPDHLETIGVRAFSGSPNIRFIRCVNYGKNHSLVPPSFTATAESDYGQAFSSEIWPDCMLAIPAGMFMNYKECAGWKNFKTFAYWHDTDVSPDSIYFTGKMSGEERKVRTLTPVTIPANATILNFVVQNSNPESVEISTEYVDSKTMRLQAKLVKVGTADVTVYANLVKTSFMISVSVYTGIEDVDADASPARYFTLDGIEVAHPQKGVMYIKIQQNKSQKVVY